VTAEPAEAAPSLSVETVTEDAAPVEPAATAGEEAQAAATEEVAEPGVVPIEEEPAPRAIMTGTRARYYARLRLGYEYRALGEDKDNDVYAYLYANARNLNKGTLDFYTSMRLRSDIDSSSQSQADDPYRSVDDSDGVTEDRVLQLYGDMHDRYKTRTLRVGRQYVDIADYIQIDGAQATLFEEGTIGGRVYAGHPVSYYSGVSGDFAGGVSVIGRPWEGNRLRLTVARYEDDSLEGTDHNYYVDLRQELTEETRVRGQVSVLNDEFRMGRFDLFHFAADGVTDLSIGGSYWGAFDAETTVYSPLYDIMGEQQPYAQAYARLTQEIVPTFLISPGASLRFVEDVDSDFSNRDYQNYDVTFIYEPDRSFSTSVAIEYWAVEDDDSFFGLTGEMRYRHQRIWEVSGGASFAQYTYDTYSDITYAVNGGQTVFYEGGTVVEESPYVYTYFIRGKWKVLRKMTLRAQFDAEDDESLDDIAYRARGSVEVRY
jgi:hypothetical protein